MILAWRQASKTPEETPEGRRGCFHLGAGLTCTPRGFREDPRLSGGRSLPEVTSLGGLATPVPLGPQVGGRFLLELVGECPSKNEGVATGRGRRQQLHVGGQGTWEGTPRPVRQVPQVNV